MFTFYPAKHDSIAERLFTGTLIRMANLIKRPLMFGEPTLFLNFMIVTMTAENYIALNLLVQHSEKFYIMATEH